MPNERNLALGMVLGVLSEIESYLESEPEMQCHPEIYTNMETAQKILAQDVEVDEHGEIKLRKGVAKNRRIAIEDEEMRHGRKSRTQKFNGYKRHIFKDLDTGTDGIKSS
ncbi:MAG: hypothetical protein AAGA60_26830 [Cyanobacteria bacterium P01_E01_bin.42]